MNRRIFAFERNKIPERGVVVKLITLPLFMVLLFVAMMYGRDFLSVIILSVVLYLVFSLIYGIQRMITKIEVLDSCIIFSAKDKKYNIRIYKDQLQYDMIGRKLFFRFKGLGIVIKIKIEATYWSEFDDLLEVVRCSGIEKFENAALRKKGLLYLFISIFS